MVGTASQCGLGRLGVVPQRQRYQCGAGLLSWRSSALWPSPVLIRWRHVAPGDCLLVAKGVRCQHALKAKPQSIGGNHFDNSVWFIDKPTKKDLHPTMKPVELV